LGPTSGWSGERRKLRLNNRFQLWYAIPRELSGIHFTVPELKKVYARNAFKDNPKRLEQFEKIFEVAEANVL
jgi:hypothetical protein